MSTKIHNYVGPITFHHISLLLGHAYNFKLIRVGLTITHSEKMQSSYDQSSMPSQYDYYRQLNELSLHSAQYQMSPYEQLLLQQQQKLLQQQGICIIIYCH